MLGATGMTHDAFIQSAEVVHSKTQMNQLMVSTHWILAARMAVRMDQTGWGDSGWTWMLEGLKKARGRIRDSRKCACS